MDQRIRKLIEDLEPTWMPPPYPILMPRFLAQAITRGSNHPQVERVVSQARQVFEERHNIVEPPLHASRTLERAIRALRIE